MLQGQAVSHQTCRTSRASSGFACRQAPSTGPPKKTGAIETNLALGKIASVGVSTRPDYPAVSLLNSRQRTGTRQLVCIARHRKLDLNSCRVHVKVLGRDSAQQRRPWLIRRESPVSQQGDALSLRDHQAATATKFVYLPAGPEEPSTMRLASPRMSTFHTLFSERAFAHCICPSRRKGP